MLPDWEYRSRDAEPDQEKMFEYTFPRGRRPFLRPFDGTTKGPGFFHRNGLPGEHRIQRVSRVLFGHCGDIF